MWIVLNLSDTFLFFFFLLKFLPHWRVRKFPTTPTPRPPNSCTQLCGEKSGKYPTTKETWPNNDASCKCSAVTWPLVRKSDWRTDGHTPLVPPESPDTEQQAVNEPQANSSLFAANYGWDTQVNMAFVPLLPTLARFAVCPISFRPHRHTIPWQTTPCTAWHVTGRPLRVAFVLPLTCHPLLTCCLPLMYHSRLFTPHTPLFSLFELTCHPHWHTTPVDMPSLGNAARTLASTATSFFNFRSFFPAALFIIQDFTTKTQHHRCQLSEILIVT